ncbi:hypothetical protein BB560_003141 [Smittium megazygosporum]|uniref:Acid phosphatase n=1 Tax=Smittium megazygosporum TaxID=133381 RepID=A0A2T9ZCY6_9FUNG|nr:hypothetical protein BB560_003141 [Smittium megazygosporum]
MVSVKVIGIIGISSVIASAINYEGMDLNKRDTTTQAYTLPDFANNSYDYCQAPKPSAKTYTPVANSTLAFVQYVIRHGGRTPYQILPGVKTEWYDCSNPLNYITNRDVNGASNNDFVTMKQTIIGSSSVPNNFDYKLWKGNCVSGQLVDFGKSQLVELGGDLRGIYVDKLGYLNDTLKENSNINVRTSYIWRTQDSASSLLSGLYPKSKRESGAYVTMGYKPAEIDTLFENSGACPAVGKLSSAYMAEPAYNSYLSNYTSKMNRVANIMGAVGTPGWNVTWYSYMDITQAQRCLKKAYTCGADGDCITDSDAKLAMNMNHFAVAYQKRDWAQSFKLLQLGVGPLFSEMLKEMGEAIEFDKKNPNSPLGTRKFSLYSAHDATVSNIIGAFRGSDVDMLWPEFASNLALEVWRDNKTNEYSIRAIYNGRILQVQGLNGTKTPWCDFSSCKWSDYNNFLSKYIVSDIKTACSA